MGGITCMVIMYIINLVKKYACKQALLITQDDDIFYMT